MAGRIAVLVAFTANVGEIDMWRSFTSPAFRHCLAYTIEEDASLYRGPRITVTEATTGELIVRAVALTVPQLVDALHRNDDVTSVLETWPRRRRPALTMPRPINCVEVTKRLLNIHDLLTITPRDLARRLLDDGARVVK